MTASNDSRLLSELRAAAVADRPCPTNDDLCGLIGYSRPNAAAEAVRRIERSGAFKVERFNNARVVTFPDGKSTARPAKEVPHWRNRRRAPTAEGA